MNTDLSVAPEIALLAAPVVPAQTDAPAPRTDGRLAGDLAALAVAAWAVHDRQGSLDPKQVADPLDHLTAQGLKSR